METNESTNDTKKVDNTDTKSISSLQIKSKHIEWSPENEMIMVEWCDIAQCYKWLNSRAHTKYSYMHAWFTIPAITLSTISGTASFAQASLPINYQTYAPMVIGALNIFIGILTTVQQYLKISELNEAHRVSAISWDKFARNIRIELAKSPEERMDAGQFIKVCRQEYDRLMETSPAVNAKTVNEFIAAFKGKEGSIERKRFDQLKKPDICNIIVSANEYRHSWYLHENDICVISNDEMDKNVLKMKEDVIYEKERQIVMKEKEDLENKQKKDFIRKAFHKTVLDLSNKVKQETKILEDYVAAFVSMYGRKPVKDEIERYANDYIENDKMEKNTLVVFLQKHENSYMDNL